MATTKLVAADGDDVAASRVRFLAAETVEPGLVRGSILASWHRSHRQKVVADQVALDYRVQPDVDSPLTRSAEPVLLDLRDRLDGQPVSIILTDHTGLVLRRLTADRGLEKSLDRVLLAPGFSYAEKDVGTNGIGTALEVGGPAHVFGHEHYAENLDQFGCAAVPIRHPISGRTVGAIDLTCWQKDAGPLLLTLAKTTADQIRQALMADAGAHQIQLFQEYLRTCQRMTGAVFAFTGDAVMMNDVARSVLDPVDQVALLDQAIAALSAGRRGSVDAKLPTGLTARMHCRPVPASGPSAGVVHVRFGPLPASRNDVRPDWRRLPLPGLVGAAPLWLRCCDDVERGLAAAQWLAVEGEPGVGKLAVLRAAHARHQLVGRLIVLDAADAVIHPQWLTTVRAALLEDARSVVLRHVDRLDGRRLRALAAILEDSCSPDRTRPPWVAVTLGTTTGDDNLDQLLQMFPRSVEVPPLRLRLDDLPQLVEHFLTKIGSGGRLECSPQVIRLLMHTEWPGNADELQQMLRQVIKHRRAGSIQPEDLPPGRRSVGRRLLTPLESLERDAIVQTLADLGGDKVKAAQSLGMSRATIYRRIHEYGIVGPIS